MKKRRVLFDPFEEFLRTFRREQGPRPPTQEGRENVWYPGVDVYEIEMGLIVVIELPGVKKENLDITLEDGYLVIQGTRYEPVYYFLKCHHREILYGKFKRSIKLPRKVDEDGVKAELKEGFLLTYLPFQKEQISKIQID